MARRPLLSLLRVPGRTCRAQALWYPNRSLQTDPLLRQRYRFVGTVRHEERSFRAAQPLQRSENGQSTGHDAQETGRSA